MKLLDMEVKIAVVGEYETNCYILKKDDKVLIVDPGSEFAKIKEVVGTDKVVGILVTHRHFDHIGALEACVEEYQVPIYEKDTTEEKEYIVPPFRFQVIFTPGHTEDSITFYFPDYDCFVIGDFIFAGSIGRMDLGGDEQDMGRSIKKIYEAHRKRDGLILPGHGIHSDLTYEQLTNPYIEHYLKRK